MKKELLKILDIDWGGNALEIDSQTESFMLAKFGKREIETPEQLKTFADEIASYWEKMNYWQATGEKLESVKVESFKNDFYIGYAIIINNYYNITYYTWIKGSSLD